MDNIVAIPGLLLLGATVGSYITTKVLAFRTRKKRHAMRNALKDIASHKWDTGEHNDAVIIVRRALKGLEGEE